MWRNRIALLNYVKEIWWSWVYCVIGSVNIWDTSQKKWRTTSWKFEIIETPWTNEKDLKLFSNLKCFSLILELTSCFSYGWNMCENASWEQSHAWLNEMFTWKTARKSVRSRPIKVIYGSASEQVKRHVAFQVKVIRSLCKYFDFSTVLVGNKGCFYYKYFTHEEGGLGIIKIVVNFHPWWNDSSPRAPFISIFSRFIPMKH